MISRSFNAVSLSLMLLCGVSLCGCGGGPDDMPNIGEVTGKVTVDGQPGADLVVTFQPKGGRPSYDTTDADGNYELQYNGSTKGAKVGSNLVTISTASDTTEDYSSAAASVSKPDPIPAKYNTQAASNSEMTVDVKPGSNEFNWDVKTK